MSLHFEGIKEYQELLSKSNVQKTYTGLVKYMMSLRTHFANKYEGKLTAGHFYQGYMDYTYFSLVPQALKDRKLKIVVNLDHSTMQIEVYLVGQNKKIRDEYLDLFLKNNWNKYHISTNRQDSILDEIIINNPDFEDIDTLNKQIDKNVMEFTSYVTSIL